MSTGSQYQGTDNLESMEAAKNYNSFLESLVRIHQPQSKESVPTLDFGAGTGTLCIPLFEKSKNSNQHLNITCLEPDTGLREALKYKGFRCFSNIAEIEDGTFSYVYSFNVLEHIEHDLEALKKLYRVLTTNGNLLIYVPAFQCLYGPMDKKVGHFRRYRKFSLKSRIEEAGFSVSKCEYVDCLGFFTAYLHRFVGSRSGSLSKRSVMIYDALLFPVSRIMDRLFKNFFGKNLLILARKN